MQVLNIRFKLKIISRQSLGRDRGEVGYFAREEIRRRALPAVAAVAAFSAVAAVAAFYAAAAFAETHGRVASLLSQRSPRRTEGVAEPRQSTVYGETAMVIPPPVRPALVTKFLKPYVLRMHFSNKYVSAQVVHTPTATVAASASSQERLLRPTMESARDVSAASKIGKILGERLLFRKIPAVTVFLKRDQKYHGKIKAIIDSVRDVGVKLL